jgi:hypothetical protein
VKQRKFVTNNQWTTRNMSVEERFWSKVDKRGEHWLWLAALTPAGYGLFWLDGKYRCAHRVAYELDVGPIAEGLELDHLCRTPACVKPDHLEPVTPQVNQLRGIGLGGTNARKTHCPAGHPYDEANTYLFRTPRGGLGRQCRTCSVARTKAWREANRIG